MQQEIVEICKHGLPERLNCSLCSLDLDRIQINNKFEEKIKQLEDRLVNLSILINQHEEYLIGIHNIALCDPAKISHNHKILEERVKNLESENDKRIDTIGCIDSAYDEAFRKVEKRIDALEKLNQECFEADPIKSIDERLEKLEKCDQFNTEFIYILKNRVEKLEMGEFPETNKSKWQNNTEYNINNIYEIIKSLESEITAINKQKFSEFHDLRPDIEKLKNEINNWEEEFYFLKSKLFNINEKPYKCPACDGKRKELFILPAGGYYEQDCKSCEGKGIVWG